MLKHKSFKKDFSLHNDFSRRHLCQNPPALAGGRLIKQEFRHQSDENLDIPIHHEQLAYIIYTSGTTGNPKGVMVSHQNLVNAYYGWEEAYQLSEQTTSHLQMASFSFDVCAGDIVRALLSGAKLVLCDKDDLLDPEKLYHLIIREKVDFAEFTPAVYRQLVQYLEETNQKLNMSSIVLGSDLWYMKEYQHFLSFIGKETRLINSYGLTEDSIDTTYFELDSQSIATKTVPIGKPLLNKQILILDNNKNLLPVGVVGEIFVGGKGIAKGYLNRPDLTEERFIPNPFDQGTSKLYKTGDLGRYLRDGNIELIGRADDQVKIRGLRIELSEINAILIKHPQIKESIVVDIEIGNNKQLVAYYVSKKGEITNNELKRFLQEVLPEYMIPTQWILIDGLPLTSNGKINKKALPKPEWTEKRLSNYVGARTLVESMVQNIWEEAFQRPHIGIYDKFFELGGHSLLAIQIMNRIQESFAIQLPIKVLFLSPTIYEIAEAIESQRENEKENNLEMPIVEPDFKKRYEPFPMTDIQQAYWVGRSDVFEFGNISTHSYDEMKALNIDINQFEYAWNTMIQRHEMLRAVINGDGTQQILKEVPYYHIKVIELEHADEKKVENTLKEIRQEMAHQLLPATTWPTFDVRITKLSEQIRIHLSTDSLFWDAWSFVTLIRELVMVYQNQESELKPLEFSFRDYVLAEQQIENTMAYKRAKEYWKAKVSLMPPAPELPLAKNPASVKKPIFTRLHYVLNQDAWTRLKRKATKNGLTPTALLLSVYAEVLSTYSKNPSFSLNLTFLNRHNVHPQVSDIIGEFTSLMFLSVSNQSTLTFLERAKKIQQELWNDLEHNYVSGVEILREMTRIQGAATQAKMPVVFTSALVVPVPDQEESPLPFRPVYEDGVTQTSQVWLDCGVWEDTKQLMCNWDVVKEMYPEGFIEEMFKSFCMLIELLADQDGMWHESVLPLIPSVQMEERKEINATEKELSTECLHSFMAEQLKLRPNATFIQTTKEQLSFAEVNQKANRISQWLVEQGAKPNQLIGLVMEKGWEQVVGVLAILKANAAYVPISPTLPKDRIHYMIEHSDVEMILTQSWLKGKTEDLDQNKVLFIDKEGGYSNYSDVAPKQLVQPRDLAYVIFTSGSTGTPKGVMINHEGAVNTVQDINQRFNVTENDKILALSNLNFDLSVYDIFGALQAGCTIVIPDDQLALDPNHWYKLISDHRVTVWNSVPQLMSLFTESVFMNQKKIPHSLRLVMMSGDWIPLSLPDQIKDLSENPETSIISLGGATEASIWSILFPINRIEGEWKSIPYGKPMFNQKMYVLNHQLEQCPNWVSGHIYIGGRGLALGYWKDGEKTNASFITHPRTGERLYRTGDLGRYLADGNIEFLGREDSQVKIQGYRIELGEIESTISLYPDVQNAVVLVNEQGNGNKSLVAFYVGANELSSDRIRSYLESKLPAYMIPNQFIELEKIALNVNGKVDRKALLKLVNETFYTDYEWQEPSTETEIKIAFIWSKWLDIEIGEIGIENSFFELGGDSMQVIRMITEVQKVYSQTIPLRQFYSEPTIKGLAGLLAKNEIYLS